MPHALDYARAGLSPPRWASAASAIAVAVTGATVSILCAFSGATDYIGTLSGCATGRSVALLQLEVLTPLSFGVPIVGWCLARRAGAGVVLCRAALLASLAGWITACPVCIVR